VLHGEEKRAGTLEIQSLVGSVRFLKLRSKTAVPRNFRADEVGEDKLYVQACVGA